MGPGHLQTWGPDRAGDLAALTDACLAAEGLTADELLACLWEGPGPAVVVGCADGTAAAAAAVGTSGGSPTASVRLLAVAPGARRQGRGRSLLDHLHGWAAGHGCGWAVTGGSGAFDLWPGVDRHAGAALACFGAAGYRRRSEAVVLAFPTSFRAGPAADLVVRRAIDDADADGARDLCRRHWPGRAAEVDRALEQGSCLVAVAGPAAPGPPVGLACHSVTRLGWLGPVGVAPSHPPRPVAGALVAAVATDLMAAGLSEVRLVASSGPGVLAAVTGAAPLARYVVLRRPLAGPG